jgi:hypothetical protein
MGIKVQHVDLGEHIHSIYSISLLEANLDYVINCPLLISVLPFVLSHHQKILMHYCNESSQQKLAIS